MLRNIQETWRIAMSFPFSTNTGAHGEGAPGEKRKSTIVKSNLNHQIKHQESKVLK